MSLLEQVQEKPADPIFGVVKEYKASTHPDKCTLLIGYYRDKNLQTPLLKSVAEMERRLLEKPYPREYLPIDGDAEFLELTEKLVFGKNDERICKIQTVGGTGALFLSGLLAKNWTDQIAISNETWANHWKIFGQAGLNTSSYPYYGCKELAFEKMLDALSKLPEKACILVHTNCHNPTGFDLSHEQWQELLAVVVKRGLFPILDMAYQGFGKSLEEDAYGPRLFLEKGVEFALTYTFAKNFSFYGERAGALFVVGESKKVADTVLSQLMSLARGSYSNPPMHPAYVVKGVLQDEKLHKNWLEELGQMRARMQKMREAFVEKMQEKNPKGNWGALLGSQGLFCMTGLSKEAVMQLRKEKGIFIGGEGRINLTGINQMNIDSITDSIAKAQ
ncbi:MAG: aromatic amino acid transaminase [Simkaniaceae bacterium]|nr:aromatic amino acid transaminase [Candidatus Sacchlamyda saccharinae]